MELSYIRESVHESCPDVVPITINRATITEDLENELVLQGGFGSLDGTNDFSSIRYWSLLSLELVREDDISLEDISQGFPTCGDSGSRALYRFPDGILRHLGIASSAMESLMHFVRRDVQGDFIDATMDEDQICGTRKRASRLTAGDAPLPRRRGCFLPKVFLSLIGETGDIALWRLDTCQRL